jgi:acetolactate synthase-1/2/3 large subunit
MDQMTGGQALVRTLKQYGIDMIFGLPGVQLDHLFSALYDERESIRFIHTRHEQASAYMAFGFAQSTGRVSPFAVVPGPGFLNTTAALSTAYACNAPVLCITGEIHASYIGKGIGFLHEIPDQLAVIRGLTKWAERINHPTEVPGVVGEAFKHLSTGRIRPVGLEVPMNILGMKAPVELADPVKDYEPPGPDPDLIDQAAQLLGRAKNPLIMVGGGIVGAEAELLELAEMLQAPVVMSTQAFGCISSRHYLALNMPAGYRLWGDADVVLGVGTRMRSQLAGDQTRVPPWGVDEFLKIIRMDIDPEEINRVMRPDVGILSDARMGLGALVERVPTHNTRRASREEELKTLKATVDAEIGKLEPQMSYVRAIREVLPEDGFFVEEITQIGHVARFAFPIYKPRTYITSGYQGTLGFGFPTALGVKLANPDKPVLAVCGDGGFMYNVQELATAVLHRIPLVTVVFNDNAFGNVKRTQINVYEGKVMASDLHNPDFVRLAESFGAAGTLAKTPAELKTAILKGFEEKGPTLIEVPVGEMPNPWHFAMAPPVRPKRTSK